MTAKYIIEDSFDSVIKDKMNEYNRKVDEIEGCKVTSSEMTHAMGVMEEYISSKDRKKIESIINSNNERVFELKSELNLIRDEVMRSQMGCEHDMVYIGHDSHYDYYRCSKCGFEDRW